jgi:excinuclease ABC subunit B
MTLSGKDLRAHIRDLDKRMRQAASDLDFENAARLRDEIRRLEVAELEIGVRQKDPPPLRGRKRTL